LQSSPANGAGVSAELPELPGVSAELPDLPRLEKESAHIPAGSDAEALSREEQKRKIKEEVAALRERVRKAKNDMTGQSSRGDVPSSTERSDLSAERGVSVESTGLSIESTGLERSPPGGE